MSKVIDTLLIDIERDKRKLKDAQLIQPEPREKIAFLRGRLSGLRTAIRLIRYYKKEN